MIRRRDFLRTSAATIAAFAAPLPARRVSGEPPPETTRIRIGSVPSICLSPQYVAGELLRADGFTDIQYEGTDWRFLNELKKELKG